MTHGHYSFFGVILISIVTVWTIPTKIPTTIQMHSSENYFNLGLISTLFLFLGALLYQDGLIYSDHGYARSIVHLCLWIASAFSLLAAGLAFKNRQKLTTAIMSAAFFFLMARLFSLRASPQPFIDVFTVCTEAVNYLFLGMNPYSQTYHDIYNGMYDYKALPVYPPAALYWPAPFQFLLGDIRFSFILCDLITAGTFAYLTKNLPNKMLRLTPLLWLAFPVSLFVIEQSWNDLLVIMLTALLLTSIAKRRLMIAAFLLGCLLVSKQYSVFIFGLSAFYIERNWSRAEFIKAMGLALTTAFILVAPLAFNDFNHFYQCVIAAFLNYKMRPDSLSLAALIQHTTKLVVPNFVLFGGGVIAFLISVLNLLRSEKGQISTLTAGLCFTYSVVFLLGKQAFCNYYYFVAALLLLHITFVARERS